MKERKKKCTKCCKRGERERERICHSVGVKEREREREVEDDLRRKRIIA